MTRQAFSFVLLEQGVADAPHLLLRSFSCGIGLGFPMWSRGVDFFGDGQPMLATEFFGHSRRPIADEGGVVDLPAEADSICDDVHVVDVFCSAYSMVWADENGCDYGPLSRPPKAGGASAVCGNKLTSCITVVTLRYWPDSDSFDHCIPCIQTVIDCLTCILFVNFLIDLYARITASAIPRFPRRSPPNGRARCAPQSSKGWHLDRPSDGQRSPRAPACPG